MTAEQQTALVIKGIIASLPAEQSEACVKLVERIRWEIENGGEPVGHLALALVGAEAAAKEDL